MKTLIFIICVLLLIGCGTGDDGDVSTSGSPNIVVNAEDSATVSVSVGGNDNNAGKENAIEQLAESVVDSEDLAKACIACAEDIAEDEECECFLRLGCTREDLEETKYLDDLIECL